jgi:hypothetical protein
MLGGFAMVLLAFDITMLHSSPMGPVIQRLLMRAHLSDMAGMYRNSDRLKATLRQLSAY